jgi:RES domain-containing protein
MAHLSKLPTNMILLFIEIPDTLQIEIGSWTPGDLLAFRQIGDEWIKSASTVVLQVPSVLAPGQKNCLINPKHRLFGAIKILRKTPFAFDSRLLSSIPPP